MNRTFTVGLLLLFSLLAQAQSPQVFKATSPPHRVALLELYTSEGCSSCPPADRLFSGLRDFVYNEQQLIPLAFHVTYWDYIGWRDRFGDELHDRRQREQAAMNASRAVYTPQFLMNGHDYRSHRSFNNDVNRINASKAEVKIHLEATRSAATLLGIKVVTEQPGDNAYNLWLAVYENNLQSQVSDGENAGELLRHDYVVRELRGPFAVNRANEQVTTKLSLDSEWKRQDLGIVAFVQKAHSSEVVQATGLRLGQSR